MSATSAIPMALRISHSHAAHRGDKAQDHDDHCPIKLNGCARKRAGFLARHQEGDHKGDSDPRHADRVLFRASQIRRPSPRLTFDRWSGLLLRELFRSRARALCKPRQDCLLAKDLFQRARGGTPQNCSGLYTQTLVGQCLAAQNARLAA
jgi:hypothetical protein